MGSNSMTVLQEWSQDLADLFNDVEAVAIDVEGVDLGREGRISLVQISTPVTKGCLILDLLGKSRNDALVVWLRSILESDKIVKVIHDCRMDSDALKHTLDIQLRNVHDTSCWHEEITGVYNAGLNTVLAYNSMQPNINKSGDVYRSNHAFWAARPLTNTMKELAAGDIQSIYEVYRKQCLSASPEQARAAKLQSDTFLNVARSAMMARVVVQNMGRFIGLGGSRIRALQKSTNSLLYPQGPRHENTFVVYYTSPASLDAVRRAAAG